MKILMVTSEAVPFAKTGGLADVCGALPVEIANLGHDISLIMPGYRSALNAGQLIEDTGARISVQIGSKTVEASILRSRLPGSSVPVYLIHQPEYYDRAGLYQENGVDYIDNCERFVFLSRVAVEAIKTLELWPDVVHANDWTSGLVPAYLKTEYRAIPGYERIASLYTIHNLAYQGQFWHWDMLLTGLDWKYFNWHQMEYYGQLNLMKSGIVFADAINTVSPRYAQEIQGHELGCGLEGTLIQRSDDLSGILNGCDYGEWDPATDKHLPANYTPETFSTGKPVCKEALQRELGLPVEPGVPLVGLVGRLADQKGLDLIESVISQWVHDRPVQWAILGTGDPRYHQLFKSLAEQHPHKVAARLEFSNDLAHRIEAGADIFLMPSRYEPCGLNQLYSLKYGTLPVVRATGGLADTITNLTPETLAAGTANGFSFEHYSAAALGEALDRAVATYYDSPDTWARLVETAMRQDWSWGRSARDYITLYEDIARRVRQTVLV